jgi:hypothetical protein
MDAVIYKINNAPFNKKKKKTMKKWQIHKQNEKLQATAFAH